MRIVRFASSIARASALPIALLLVAAPLPAESYVLRLDPATTKVTFLLDAFMHKVHGSAPLLRGEVRFDDQGQASGEIVVDATQASTGSEGRDKDMHAKVLESTKFGEIVLAIDGYEGKFDPAAPSQLQVTGRFTVHGVEHPLSLEMKLQPTGTGADRQLGATTSFTVPYVQWGMKDPSKAFLRVAKVVDVTVDARGSLLTQ